MRVVTAPEEYVMQPGEISVFLAGGITNCPNWQKEVIDIIANKYTINAMDIVIFNPRRDNFPIGDKTAAYKQIQWEFDALERCDIFSMYFSSGESDQPICMYELGRNIMRMQMRFPGDWEERIVISVEDGYRRKQDVLIQTELATNNKIYVNTQISESINKEYHVRDIVKARLDIKRL